MHLNWDMILWFVGGGFFITVLFFTSRKVTRGYVLNAYRADKFKALTDADTDRHDKAVRSEIEGLEEHEVFFINIKNFLIGAYIIILAICMLLFGIVIYPEKHDDMGAANTAKEAEGHVAQVIEEIKEANKEALKEKEVMIKEEEENDDKEGVDEFNEFLKQSIN